MMLVNDAINRIRSAIHDATFEYDDNECISYLNTAVHEIASQLIAQNSPFLIEEKAFSDGDTLPTGFFRTAGIFPIRITGNKVKLLDSVASMPVRYYKTPEVLPQRYTETTAMPFAHESLNELAVRIAVKLAANENEFDVSQDTGIQQEIQSSIQQGLGA